MMQERSKTRLLSALLACALGAGTLPAQDPEPVAPPKWPALEAKQKRAVKNLTNALRRAKKPEQTEKALTGLRALGAGAAPELIKRLTDHRTNVNAELASVLDAITEASHAPLLARHANDKRLAVRRYVLGRLTTLAPDAKEMAPVFRHSLADEDEGVAFQAALGLTACGQLDAMDRLFAKAVADWSRNSETLGQALRGVHGIDGTLWLTKKLQRGDEREKLAALRMLRSVARKENARLVAPFLDSEIHNLKKAAINTLRAIVDGEPPLEKLSVFAAIEMANEWKARL